MSKIQASALLALVFLIIGLTLVTLPITHSPRTIIVPDTYPTIEAAIGNATEGATIYIKKGIYDEHTLTINKTLTVIGEEAASTIINNIDEAPSWNPGASDFPPPKPNIVEISADDVIISGLTFTSDNGGSNNIAISAIGDRIWIEGNMINEVGNYAAIEVKGEGAKIIGNTMSKGNPWKGISVNGSNATVIQNTIAAESTCVDVDGAYGIVGDNTISGDQFGIDFNGNIGVIYNNTVDCKMSGIISLGNGIMIIGNDVTSGICGISFSSDNSTIFKNKITNGQEGVQISGSNNTIYANFISGNQLGLSVLRDQTGYAFEGGKKYFEPDRNLWDTAYNNTFCNNDFVNSAQGAADWSWEGCNAWNNGSEGNYWSDYLGAYPNHMIGDTHYIVNKPYTIIYSSDFIRLFYPGMVNLNEVADYYPRVAPFNLENVALELPDWSNISNENRPEFDLADKNLSQITIIGLIIAFAGVAGAGFLLYRKRGRGKTQ